MDTSWFPLIPRGLLQSLIPPPNAHKQTVCTLQLGQNQSTVPVSRTRMHGSLWCCVYPVRDHGGQEGDLPCRHGSVSSVSGSRMCANTRRDFHSLLQYLSDSTPGSPSVDLWTGWLHLFILCISRSINLNLYILQRSIVWRDEHPLWEQRWGMVGDRGHRAQISPGKESIITLGNRRAPRAISSQFLDFKGQGASQLLLSFVSLRPWLPLLLLP